MYILSVDSLVGQQVGVYHIESLIGRGQLTAVYRAQHTTRNVPVALTAFLIPESFSSQERIRFTQRFQREAAAFIVLQHEHILPIYAYGEHKGVPYLVTPYAMHGSLATLLKQQKRYTHREALKILEQIVPGLAYAHRQGSVHGALQPSNILLNEKQTLLIAGFGLRKILQLQGVASRDQPYAHLLSIAETFLFAPEYIAPEVVQGQPVDLRSDVYALGIIVFELLSGHPPFTGTDAFDVAKQQVQQPIPSLRVLCPELPSVLLPVMNQVLARDPAHRFQHAHAFVEAFAQGVREGIPASSSGWEQVGEKRPQKTKGEGDATAHWQITPPIITGKIAALQLSPPQKKRTISPALATGSPDTQRLVSPHVTGEDIVVRFPTVKEKETPFSHNRQPVGWIQEPDNVSFSPRTFMQSPLKRSWGGRRRRVVAFLAMSGVLAAITLIAIGVNLVGRSNLPRSSQSGNPGSTIATKRQNTVEHIGTVIGSLNMPFNATADFLNPADHQQSVLIHLPNGEFVAYEKRCSSQGAQVLYTTEMHTLICPTTQSVFDPANDGAVLQESAAAPLKEVRVRVNPDGTITAG